MVNSRALIDTLTKIWKPKHGIEARKIDDKLFSFKLFYWRGKMHIMDNQPWHFDQYAMCLSDILENGEPSDIQHHLLPLWVRFYNPPFKGCNNSQNAWILVSKIGAYVKTDAMNGMEIERSIRIRIMVDVHQSLKGEI